MNRRHFFKALGGVVAAVAVVPFLPDLAPPLPQPPVRLPYPHGWPDWHKKLHAQYLEGRISDVKGFDWYADADAPAMSGEEFNERYIKPAVHQMVEKMEADAMQACYDNAHVFINADGGYWMTFDKVKSEVRVHTLFEKWPVPFDPNRPLQLFNGEAWT